MTRAQLETVTPMVAALPRPPAEIAAFVDALGLDGALRLIEEHGGTRIYIGSQLNQASAAARLVGLEPARAMAEALGDARWVKVPLARAWRILIYRDRGLTYREIARKLGVSEDTVARHLTAAGQTVQQLDLFS